MIRSRAQVRPLLRYAQGRSLVRKSPVGFRAPATGSSLPTNAHIFRPLFARPLSSAASPSDAEGGIPDFTDAATAYRGIPTFTLVRAFCVLKLCAFSPLVNNAEFLLSLGRRVLGDRLLQILVKPTFFDHFCAGTSESGIRPTIEYLNGNGIGAILDYAAEADVGDEQVKAQQDQARSPRTVVLDDQNWGTLKEFLPPDADAHGDASRTLVDDWDDRMGVDSARVYSYSTEQECDEHIYTSSNKSCSNYVLQIQVHSCTPTTRHCVAPRCSLVRRW